MIFITWCVFDHKIYRSEMHMAMPVLHKKVQKWIATIIWTAVGYWSHVLKSPNERVRNDPFLDIMSLYLHQVCNYTQM